MLTTMLRVVTVLNADAEDFIALVRSRDVPALSRFVLDKFDTLIPVLEMNDHRTPLDMGANNLRNITEAASTIQSRIFGAKNPALARVLIEVVKFAAVIKSNNDHFHPDADPHFTLKPFKETVEGRCWEYILPPSPLPGNDVHMLYRNEVRLEDRPQRRPDQIAKPHVPRPEGRDFPRET